jgi:plastocyanin
MNEKNKIKTKPMRKSSTTIATSTMAIVICAALTIGMQTQISHQALAQTYGNTSNGMTAATSASSAVSPVSVSTSQSTNKEFWINTVHLDGMTNIHAAVKCDTCNQNTPLHPAERPPLNSTIPAGGGFRLTEPNKVGAWDFRSFTFAPDQIVVNQGDKVTLHFIGVQGTHHIITVDGIATFPLMRGQIHTVSFIAKNPGTVNYTCHLHLPNMVGQILVLPKAIV